MAQYFRRREGLSASEDLSGLVGLIGRLHEVNHKLADRIKNAAKRDATINSLVILDTLAALLEMDVDGSLEKLKPQFEVYLDGE